MLTHRRLHRVELFWLTRTCHDGTDRGESAAAGIEAIEDRDLYLVYSDLIGAALGRRAVTVASTEEIFGVT